MSRNTPPCSVPRPALTSVLIARATSSRGSRSGVRRLFFLSSYQASASRSVSAVSARKKSGMYWNMKRSPLLFLSVPPSPRTPSVTRIPRTESGQTIAVGWNCVISMSMRSAPASRAIAIPSPVDSHEFEVTFHALPPPPAPAVAPWASCSKAFRRAWCRESAPSSCPRATRCRAPRRSRPRPSRCAPCRGATCTRSPSSRRARGPRSPRVGPRRPRRSPRRRTRDAPHPRSEHDPRVGQHAHRQKADVQIRGSDDDEARPRPARVARVQGVGPAPEPEPQRLSVERVPISADEIAKRVTGDERVGEKCDVGEHEDRAEADAEVAVEVEGSERVPPQEDKERGREDERVPVKVLDEERKARFARVALARIRNGARRRRPKERAVVGAAVVVAGHAECERECHDQDRGREIPVRTNQRQRRMHAVRAEAGRVERREIRVVVVVRPDEPGVNGVEDEEPEHDDDDGRLEPPEIFALMRSMTDVDRGRRHRDRWWGSTR